MRQTPASAAAITSTSSIRRRSLEVRPWYLVAYFDEACRLDYRTFECPEGDPEPRIRAWLSSRDYSLIFALPYLAHAKREFLTDHGWDDTEDLDHVRV